MKENREADPFVIVTWGRNRDFSSRESPSTGKKTGAVLAAPENVPKEEDENTKRCRSMPSSRYMQDQCQLHCQ